MALKPDRSYTNESTDISFFMNETGEKGEVLVFSTGGSGAAMDDANAVVTTPNASPSGQNDIDLTRQHINWHKDEVQLGGKVTLLRHGVIVTNVIDTGAGISSQGITNPKPNIAVGIPAYVGRGAITSGGTAQGWLTTGPPLDERGELGRFDVEVRYRVGTFLSTRDEDGYAKVEINLP